MQDFCPELSVTVGVTQSVTSNRTRLYPRIRLKT